MKKFLKKLVMPCGDWYVKGERFRIWIILGRFWLYISKDRWHIVFEDLPF